MLIAHLPAGFILGRMAQRRWDAPGLMPAALIGSIIPDFDVFYFYLVSSRYHHHSFFMHWPLFWVTLAIVALPLIRQVRPAFLVAGFVFFMSTMLHMIMDTVAAPAYWLAPFSWHAVQMVEIPATYSHWIISFVLHWTFLLELAICAAAITLFLLGRRRARFAD